MRENTAYFCGYFFMFKKLICGIFAVAGDFKTPFYTLGMTGNIPETSRLLDALEKKYKEDYGQMAVALSFGDYGKGEGSRV